MVISQMIFLFLNVGDAVCQCSGQRTALFMLYRRVLYQEESVY